MNSHFRWNFAQLSTKSAQRSTNSNHQRGGTCPGTRTRFDMWAFVAALAISLPLAWGDYVRRVFSPSDTWHSAPAYWPVTAAWTAAITVVLYALLYVLFCSLDRMPNRTADSTADSAADSTPERIPGSTSRTARAFHSRHPLCAHVAVICACWSPYLLVRFPGNLDPDTQWQLLQFYGLAARTDQHPWFDTLVFGAFWQVGGALGSHAWSLLLYEFAQMACTACTFALCVHWMGTAGLPRGLRRFTLVFAALYPAVPLFAQTMAKDMLFAWPFMLFVLLLAEAARTHGAAFGSRRFAIAFFAVACLVMLTKKTGIYIVTASCVTLVAYMGWWLRHDAAGRQGAAQARAGVHPPATTHGRAEAPAQATPHPRARMLARTAAATLAALALVGGVWQHAVIPAMGVAPGPGKEKMSIVTQQTALYLAWHGDEMSDGDWQIVHSVFTNAQDLGTVYDPYRADATKDRWNSDAPADAQRDFLRWYAAAMLRHPDVFATAWGATALPLYYPDTTTQADESFVSYRNNLPARSTNPEATGNEGFLQGLTGDGSAASLSSVQSLMRSSYRPAWAASLADGLDAVYAFLERCVPVLFIKAVFTTWVPLVCAAYCIRRRNGAGLVMLVPALVTLATLAAAPIVLPRYVVASVDTLPLALAAAAGAAMPRRPQGSS